MWVNRQRGRGGVLSGVVFLSVAFLVWMLRGSEEEFVMPVLCGVGAVLLLAMSVFAYHWGFFTPRRLCAAKQHQLEAERRKFIAALDKERQAMQAIQSERDALKAQLGEQPLHPLELREEVDQLIIEGDMLLTSEESTAMLEEAELWLDDVERFAKRHLSPEQYHYFHDVEPPDLEEQVQHYRAHSGEPVVTQEEVAVVERLVRANAGLRELRETIRG